MRNRYEGIKNRHAELRKNFIKSLSNGACKSNQTAISVFISKIFTEEVAESIYHDLVSDYEVISECMGTSISSADDINDIAQKSPEKLMLVTIYSGLKDDNLGYGQFIWRDKYQVTHKDEPLLDAIYELLCSLGYEMSDEEKEMQNGTADIFLNTETD